jgi:hypothetical protein
MRLRLHLAETGHRRLVVLEHIRPQSVECLLHPASIGLYLPGRRPLVRVGHENTLRVHSHSGPAALCGSGPSLSYVSAGARSAQESPCHSGVFSYLLAAQRISGSTTGKQAVIDAPRTGEGTVPGTVPGVIQAAMRTGSRIQIPIPTCCSKAGGVGAVIVDLNLKGTSGPVRKVIRRPTCAATRSAIPAATLPASPVAVRDVVCAAIR